ncbi:PAS domain S-box-containing protein/diguanylate cyclase (GGDEF) domain-containing protein [Pseudidiomarina planktonica]|uniref:cyclic-guanylate-specific phosphodiesterase n=1 Tax=Pseudidiomarina planktonica TaxID=1323738 RepID=A0A1Y6ETH3_9GAMM|nr:EAL domain-containing protein [Pseudidiomarina planktonica]SMQ63473.1 PAS domain S-box-containing protein/diguanylate cyclase (GGDEF) domain-containing protein [Pseudidiomarina planktonica]
MRESPNQTGRAWFIPWRTATHLLVIVCALMIPVHSATALPMVMQTSAADSSAVALIAVRQGNEPVAVEQLDERNSVPLYDATQLFVPATNNPISFEFTTLNPTPSNALLSYRYRLLGFNDSWVYTDADSPRATYTNLSFGEYNLQLQAASDGTNWGALRELKLVVETPWWLTVWAISAYVLAALALLFILVNNLRGRRQASSQLRASEERLKLSLWGSGDQLWDWDIVTGAVYRHNIWTHFADFPLDGKRAGHKDAMSNIHPHDLNKVRTALQSHLDEQTPHFEITYRVRVQDDWLWLLDRGKVVERNEQGQPLRMTGTMKDVSSIVAAEERLKMLAASITNISDGVCIYDNRFRVIETNRSFQRITGYSRESMLGKPLRFKLYNQEYIEQIKRQLAQHGSWHGEIEDLRKDEQTYQMELTIDAVRDDTGHTSHYVASFSDITDRKQSERELRRLANTDTLTGLPNRSYFQVSHSNLVRKRIQHALLVFDLDNFKKINDSLGHEVGDQLLCQVAERLAEVGRPQDTLYRLGGDEFSLILEDTSDLNIITSIAKRVNDSLAQPFALSDGDLVVSSSVGIVAYPNDGNSSQELLQNADTAMYHAKRRGGNGYQFFNESMNQSAVRRLKLENQLRQALRDGHVEVHYQPKLALKDRQFVGLEALARLNIPGVGMINPVDFIPLAEETGLIIELGERVLQQACRDMKQWVEQGLVSGRVAVNLSARQFMQPDLSARVTRILNAEGMAPEHLELEITEGVLMEDPERAIEIMTDLQTKGIDLALDDFGTGYSSLAYLKRFPIQTLKIDKAFINDISQAERDRKMVASIIAMAHNLGLHVVAEGVENKDQLTILSTLNCEYAQGFLFAKPLPASELLQRLAIRVVPESTPESA